MKSIGSHEIGRQMHQLAQEIFPYNRSLTGEGVRKTLHRLQTELSDLKIHAVPSGTACFDWTVPQEWDVQEAWIKDPSGKIVVDFRQNNLHLVSYSRPVDTSLSLEELQQHLHSLPAQPNAIPYITSYYRDYWGFCLSHEVRQALRPGKYQVKINSQLKPGVLNYGEWILPGESSQEIFFSTYICHPSMANNELSGPMVATFLAKWLKSLPKRRFTYRFIFIPETVGSLLYLSRHHGHLKKHVVAGFNLTCLGDENTYSYMPSRQGNTLADQVALHVLGHLAPYYQHYSFLDRGGDERQFCAPGIDLPVCSIMRSKYGAYPEYHTSLDDMNFITPKGLQDSLTAYQYCVELLENNFRYRHTTLGEPQLGRRNLYVTPETYDREDAHTRTRNFLDILAYADGTLDLVQLAKQIRLPSWKAIPLIQELLHHGLLEKC